MRSLFWGLAAALSVTVGVLAVDLDDVCTTDYVEASLPSDDYYVGITINTDSLTVNAVYNSSSGGGTFYPNATFDYCNVTFTYTHNGRDDEVIVWYWLPTPDSFQNRYLSTGGGGFAISSGDGSLPGGLIYGAVAGTTDGGFGGFSTSSDEVFLIQNGTVNWESLFMFGYEAIHELSALGKELTKQFFNMSSTNATLYSYYQGCSEGGRDGWDQLQRYGDEFDGAVVGAPAFRFSFQQILHLYSAVVEHTLDYYPPPCELEVLLNYTIEFCDPLDGKADGVVARTDLCKLNLDLNKTIGTSYYCAESTSSSGGPGGPPGSSSSYTPAQNGSVTAEGVAVVNQILAGMYDSQGRKVYLSFQPSADLGDATTSWDNTTNSWQPNYDNIGSEFVTRYLDLLNASTIPTLDGVTYDTLREWIYEGWLTYHDTLHTTWPDLTPLHKAGGKVLHFHGESDGSIPTGSSVHYYDSVRQIMYPNLSFNDSYSALGEWYRLFLIPGAGHCGPNSQQPNGPFPETTLQTVIDWVENGIVPTTLNGTITEGDYEGESQQICAWPLRPYWTGNTSDPDCVYDQKSIDTWLGKFDSFPMPVY